MPIFWTPMASTITTPRLWRSWNVLGRIDTKKKFPDNTVICWRKLCLGVQDLNTVANILSEHILTDKPTDVHTQTHVHTTDREQWRSKKTSYFPWSKSGLRHFRIFSKKLGIVFLYTNQQNGANLSEGPLETVSISPQCCPRNLKDAQWQRGQLHRTKYFTLIWAKRKMWLFFLREGGWSGRILLHFCCLIHKYC